MQYILAADTIDSAVYCNVNAISKHVTVRSQAMAGMKWYFHCKSGKFKLQIMFIGEKIIK